MPDSQQGDCSANQFKGTGCCVKCTALRYRDDDGMRDPYGSDYGPLDSDPFDVDRVAGS